MGRITTTTTVDANVRFNNDTKVFEGWNGRSFEAIDDNTPISDLVYTAVNYSTVPEYADNAAAVTGGLSTGDMYKTTTVAEAALNIVS